MKGLNWSKRDEKAFNKLSDKDKEALIKVIASNAMNDALVNTTTRFVITGDSLRSKNLYERYVKKLDRMPVGSDIWIECVEQLLSDIRIGYIKYKQMNGDGESDGGPDREENN